MVLNRMNRTPSKCSSAIFFDFRFSNWNNLHVDSQYTHLYVSPLYLYILNIITHIMSPLITHSTSAWKLFEYCVRFYGEIYTLYIWVICIYNIWIGLLMPHHFRHMAHLNDTLLTCESFKFAYTWTWS